MFHTDGVPDRRYDCYVIGAGPAGITLALELAKANRTVLVFETGTATEPREDMPNAINYGHFANDWWNRHSVRTLGGTSRIWTAWCAPLMDQDFDNPAADDEPLDPASRAGRLDGEVWSAYLMGNRTPAAPDDGGRASS